MSEGPFDVVPVIDLRGGLVVRARAGARDTYAPIETPLSPSAEPAAVARGLVAAVPARRLYVADLDAIAGRPADIAGLRAIAAACPGIELWVDAGFATGEAVADFLSLGLGRAVLGSESQADVTLVRRFRADAILSLDSRGEVPLGPAPLHEDASLWPDDVIVMTLARVGLGLGPDLERIAAARRLSPRAKLYAAGGLRGPEDLPALRRAGAAGALVASAIHDGRLRREHLGLG
ncbi:HisA/HisF-related TIM barrel protein [Salinarimonas soli]|uniref:Nickel transporter n=1 Tax=Salinarimonas soli TaxID=1638099 RepID=A0A5B2VF67_9HYPH|nr:HisA/HisF-related TIM barrel protein [Salinarimonas soli]KAA2237505.1 nickel transporter [Salinarimonas soli]